MFCSKCGKQVADGIRFCPECGTAPAVAAQHPAAIQPVDTAAGTRDQFAKTNLVYPKNPPITPHLCWVNLVVSGLAQMIYGQVAKGAVILAVTIASNLVLPIIPAVGIGIVSIVDAFMVGKALKAGKPVGKWQFFPKA